MVFQAPRYHPLREPKALVAETSCHLSAGLWRPLPLPGCDLTGRCVASPISSGPPPSSEASFVRPYVERDPTHWVGVGSDKEERGELPGHALEKPRALLSAWFPSVLALFQKVPRLLLRGTKRQSVGLRGLWDKLRSLIQEMAERGE